MRGAGCTYNDIVDEDIDDKVERTRSRPLPSGQVTQAARPGSSWCCRRWSGSPCCSSSTALPSCSASPRSRWSPIYPFMKRITDWPQLVLGLAFSWGALMGWAAAFGDLARPALLLYAGSILWVIGYDTIYAHQDKEDDALVGVRSTARLFGDATKSWLVGLYGGALMLFARAPMRRRRCRCRRWPDCSPPARTWRGRSWSLDIDRAGPVPEAVQVEQRGRLADLPRPGRRRRCGWR